MTIAWTKTLPTGLSEAIIEGAIAKKELCLEVWELAKKNGVQLQVLMTLDEFEELQQKAEKIMAGGSNGELVVSLREVI